MSVLVYYLDLRWRYKSIKELFVIENIIDERLDDASTFKFDVTGSVNEPKILRDFKGLLESHFNRPHHLLCAHNGKEFDFPFIARRMIIHHIELPFKLNLFCRVL